MGWFGKNQGGSRSGASRQGVKAASPAKSPTQTSKTTPKQSGQSPYSPPASIPVIQSSPRPRSPTSPVNTSATKKDIETGGGDISKSISELQVVDRPPREERQYDVQHDETGSYSREEESAEDPTSYDDSARQNHLNSLFNGHLMKWKFEAEEGSAFIRVPAFLGALGLIVTLIVAMVLEDDAFTFHAIVMGVCVFIMGLFILILDGRFLVTNPLSTRAHLRNILTRNFNMFRFLWGRGLLYIIAGVLNIAQMWLMTMISGGIMILIGIVAIIVGVHASRKFAALRNSLADESFLLLVFSNYDGDGDGYLAPNEFALLLADLGMELDDRYTLKAFNVIDTDSDRRISFEEFNHWWASGYIERGRKRYMTDEEEDTYRRMN